MCIVMYYKIVKPEIFQYQTQLLLSTLIKRDTLMPYNITSYLLVFDASRSVTQSLRPSQPTGEKCWPITLPNENELISTVGDKIELASVTTTLLQFVSFLDVQLHWPTDDRNIPYGFVIPMPLYKSNLITFYCQPPFLLFATFSIPWWKPTSAD